MERRDVSQHTTLCAPPSFANQKTGKTLFDRSATAVEADLDAAIPRRETRG
jgi:hypothetical protein